MLEDLFLDSYAEVNGKDRKEIAIELILALIGLGIQVLAYYQDHCKQTKRELLRQAKYPTLATRMRFHKRLVQSGYQGDKNLAESVIFHAMKKADLDDVMLELEEPKNSWIF